MSKTSEDPFTRATGPTGSRTEPSALSGDKAMPTQPAYMDFCAYLACSSWLSWLICWLMRIASSYLRLACRRQGRKLGVKAPSLSVPALGCHGHAYRNHVPYKPYSLRPCQTHPAPDLHVAVVHLLLQSQEVTA